MPSRLLSATLATLACMTAVAAPASAHTLANWDKKQQSQVVKAGLMQKLPGGFHGEQPLASGDLTSAFAALSLKTGTPAVTVSSAPLSVTRFDALLVSQLGLSDAANTFQAGAQNAGLQPPSYFGTEVVARLLSLRYNHLAADDKLELYPTHHKPRALPPRPHPPRGGRRVAGADVSDGRLGAGQRPRGREPLPAARL